MSRNGYDEYSIGSLPSTRNANEYDECMCVRNGDWPIQYSFSGSGSNLMQYIHFNESIRITSHTHISSETQTWIFVSINHTRLTTFIRNCLSRKGSLVLCNIATFLLLMRHLMKIYDSGFIATHKPILGLATGDSITVYNIIWSNSIKRCFVILWWLYSQFMQH